MIGATYSSLAKVGRWLGGAALLVSYYLLAYYSSTAEIHARMPALGLSVSALPALLFLLWLALRASRRALMLALWLVPVVLLLAYWPVLEHNFNWIYFIENIGTNVLLGFAFGHTLVGGRRPLISRLAEMMRGPLQPAVARYTRQATFAWTLFFVVMTLVSTVLFLLAPFMTWLLFANILNWPLVIGMFVAEYLVRLRLLPGEREHGIVDSMRAYWKSNCATADVSENP